MSDLKTNTDVAFSRQAKLFATRYRLIALAETHFWDEWRCVLEAVGLEWRKRGYLTYVESSSEGRWGFLQIACAHWPKPFYSSIHFEVSCNRDMVLHEEMAQVTLEVEKDIQDKEKLIRHLQGIMEPYESSKLLVQTTGCVIVPNSGWRVILGKLPLNDLSSKKIIDAINIMMPVETFVDEALFTFPGKTIWRTSFFDNEPKAEIRWSQWNECGATSEIGGWEQQSWGGRLDSPCLRCNGGKNNHRHGNNILWLKSSDGYLFHNFTHGQKVYACAVVHAPRGGQLSFYIETTKEGGWRDVFNVTKDILPLDSWQLVSCEGQIISPSDYDCTNQGLACFVIVKAPECGLKIDSIEIGTIPS